MIEMLDLKTECSSSLDRFVPVHELKQQLNYP